MEITQEQFDELKRILRFYADGSFYYYEGCQCHGRDIITDHGETAQDGLTILNAIE